MCSRIEIKGAELKDINGGKITYTWDGTEGSIGINGYNNFKLLDKDAFGEYYTEHKDSMDEVDILRNLYAMGIIEEF